MFLAPVRVLEVSPPRPRKKERRIASHRVSPPTSASLPPHPPPPLFPPSPSRLLRCTYIGGGTDARTSIFQCPVRRMRLFSSPSCSPPSFSGSLASVGFPRSWLCHLVPDGRSFPHSPSSSLNHRPIARIFDHGAFRASRPGTRRERLPFFSPGAPSAPRC